MRYAFGRKLAVFAAALLFAGAAAAEPVKIALDSPPDPDNSGTFIWAHALGEHLKANGIEAEEYQRGALGEEAERLDQVSSGLLEVSMSALGSAGSLDKLIFGLFLPYLFDDMGQVDKALLEGGMLEKINAATTPKGVRVLDVVNVGLPAGIFNTKKPVNTLADMKGLRMRALDENQIKLFEAWGASGTIVDWAEVPNALQTGVADGYLNPPFVPLLFGHAEFIKHFTDAAASPSLRVALASEDWYQGLSDEQRKTVDDAVAAARKANRDWLGKRGGILKKLEEAGIAVVQLTPEARAEFREASQALYEGGVLSAEQVSMWKDAAAK